jgi:uncharacterized protein (DUF2141 family)
MRPLRSAHRAAMLMLATVVFAFVALGGFTAYAQDTSDLTIRIVGARSANGKIGIALFDSSAGFPGDTSKAIRREIVTIDPRSLNAEVVLRNVARGTIALSVFHDENANGKLDKNFMGVPKEGYGASNNPRKRMGPPSFDEAKFAVTQPVQTIEIKLTY